MANFYIDNKHLKFHLLHPLMKQIISLRERNFIERDNYDYAPLDFEDTMDSRLLKYDDMIYDGAKISIFQSAHGG